MRYVYEYRKIAMIECCDVIKHVRICVHYVLLIYIKDTFPFRRL